jgi:hypothetical protein
VRLSLVLVVLVACSHSAPPPPLAARPASTWRGPEILANVPADTPYLFGVLEPMPEPVRDRLYAQSEAQMMQALKKAASGSGKVALVAAAMYSEIDGNGHWLDALGFGTNARMVLYGLSIWPVLRIEVKDPVRVREVLARVVKAGDSSLQPQTFGRAALYVLKEDKTAYVFGVVDKELVGAILPADMLDRAMPMITGAQKPAHSLRDAKVLPALLAKHHYLSSMILFVDSLRVIDAVTGHGKGENDQLVGMLEGKLTPACHQDLERIGSVMPRFVLGYRRLDEQGFAATMAVELPASVIKSLEKLHTPMPAMPIRAQPMLAIGAAVNLDAMFGWMRDTAGTLRAHPFRCDAFDKLNHSIDELASTLDKPVPPMVQGLRGFELVIDDATVMPPAGTGHLLVAGDHIVDLVHQLLAKVPQLATLHLESNGVAAAVPLEQLGIPSSIKSAHMALRATKAALAVGDGSSTRASERVAAPDAHAPLITFSFDLAKVKERFGMFLKEEDLQNLENLGSTVLSLDVGDDGIYIEMVGTWTHGR